LIAIPETVPVTLRFPMFAEAILELAIVAEEVTERVPATAFVVVTLVNTPVLGVVAPIGVFSIVPPLMVRASAMLLSPREPVIEPNEPSANVTLALPSVPELTAVADTLPVASIVSVLDVIASVILLAGRATVPVTLIFPTFKLATLELANVLAPVKTLLFAKYARLEVPANWLTLMPVMVVPVNANVPVIVVLPRFADAMLEEANVLAPVKIFVLAKYAMLEVPERLLIAMPDTVPVTFKLPIFAEAMLDDAIVAEEVTVRVPATAFVVVTFVNTPVDGVVAPIGEFSIVPPLIVSASATLLSPSEPVIEPNEPSARVTLALPSVPEFTAVAETLPVASIVSVLDTIASVTLFAGSETVPVTVMLPIFADAMLLDANVFAPVKMLLLAKYANEEVPANWLTLIPVIVVPVNARVPVIVVLPRFAEAMLELAKVFAPVKILVFAKYAIDEVPERLLIAMPEMVPVTLRLPTLREAILEEATVSEEVTDRTPTAALVVVTLVNTPVEGVVAPIGVFSIVPPLIVRASETLLSPRVPVMLPKLPSARVTLALPRVPEFTAVAETLPVASIVSVFETMASVIEFAGKATVPVTLILPAFRLATLELANVLAPVKILLFAKYASDEVPAS
jgi:hypothetical protein